MKRRILCISLALMMALLLLPATALAASGSADPAAGKSDYFYQQLNPRAKKIYDLMLSKFQENTDEVLNGTLSIELTGTDIASDADVESYRKGNKDLYNDFTAAKDALDLDHSELWWLDSGYFSFRLTNDDKGYHISIGPGRAKNYLLAGQEIDHNGKTVEAMQAEVDEMIQTIVDKARKDVEEHGAEYSDTDKKAALVRSVHDQIGLRLSYRYETDCTGDDGKYIRTLYALVTQKGVCEAYARAMQVCLTKLGVECVLVHGLQTKGTPEDHMWNAVRLDDGDTERWYVVDATWDDPVSADWYGERDTSTLGIDGKENTTYLLVGQNVVGDYWHPSGYVSTGNFEFTYPTIETSSYDGSTAYESDSGLKVSYTAGTGSMEEGTPAGVFKVSFQGMSQEEAAAKGFYFLIKMYDYHPDGTYDAMDTWYYCSAAMAFLTNSKYFFDSPSQHGMFVYTGTCEYVEIAVTTRKPQNYDQWQSRQDWTLYWEEAYYHGTDEEIIADSGMLYNSNSGYEAPPYVLSQTPAPNGNCTAGVDYRFRVTYDDDLIHPLGEDPSAVDDFTDNTTQAARQKVQVRYATYQQDLHSGGIKAVQIAGDLPFDIDRDGIVDMDPEKNPYVDFKWLYKSDTPDAGGQKVGCTNTEYHANGPKECSVEAGCPIVGVEFNFRASNMWIDDITEYNFSIEGVVGSRSAKFPNDFDTISCVPGLCPACYRSQGIDWNLWGQPTLLDAPENLDLRGMAESGGTDAETLAKLQEEMNTSDLNGRLMLVVEDNSKGSGSREDYEAVNGELESELGIKDSDIKSSSVYEINFNRICPMVNLQPGKGQSLRVQVGYPAGITYEMLTQDNPNVVLKAYHFTRCDANHRCENYSDTGHVDGEHIVGVDEIQITPTPYGMVIICNSFSPFEIVVLDNSSPAVQNVVKNSEFNYGDTVVTVVSDGNGKVTYTKDGAIIEAVGPEGDIVFDSGTSQTFTVVPSNGYVVDTVSLGGKEIAVDKSNNTFTLTEGENVTTSDVLSVTFLPEEIKKAEEEAGIQTVVASVCAHTSTHITKAAQEATCTAGGKTAEVVCDTCGQIVTHQADVPAHGHTPVEEEPALAPDCETKGHRAKIKCSTCDEYLSNGEELEPLGHQFVNYEVVEGTANCAGTTKRAKCERCGVYHEYVDATMKDDKVHDFSVTASTTPATCTEDQVDTLKCSRCDVTKTEVRNGTATGHTPDEKGICETCKTYVCANGHLDVVNDEAVPATCTENGKTAGSHCATCGEVITAQEVITAKGHDFPEHQHDEQVKCNNCEELSPLVPHTPETIPGKEPTCTEDGLTAGEKCSVCNDIIVQQTRIPATGHKWDTDTLQWVWAVDGDKVSASAIATCLNDPEHTETFKADEVTYSVVEEPTCTDTGLGKYTATVTIGETVCTDDHDEQLIIPATGHKFETWEYQNDATCTTGGTEKSVCANDCGTVETRASTHEPLGHDYAKDIGKAPTCTEDGYMTDTCTRCGDQKTGETINKLGHISETVKGYPATCLEPGLSDGEICSRCKTVLTAQTTIPSTGAHQWNENSIVWNWVPGEEGADPTAEANISCSVCHTTQTYEAQITKTSEDATCTEPGNVTYTATVTIGEKEFTSTNTILGTSTALGHDLKAEWSWTENEDAEPTVTALITCTRGDVNETLTAVVTGKSNDDATCTTPGTVTYTATVEYDSQTFTDTRTYTGATLPHELDPGTISWKWTEDHEATATVKCKNCDYTEEFKATVEHTHKDPTCTAAGEDVYTATVTVNGEEYHDTVTVALEMVPHTEETVPGKDATCTEAGLTEGSKCSVCGATLKEQKEIPALGHDFVNHRCTRCGAVDPNYTPSTGSSGTLPPPPGSDKPGTDKPGTDEPGADEPGADEPGTDEPGTDEPGTDEPGASEPSDVTFKDVASGAWYAGELGTVTERGLIRGDQNGNFNPDMHTSRGQLMTILARLAGVDTDSGSVWYEAGMKWAVEQGISDGSRPEEDLTREELITMLYRYMKPEKAEGELDFPDASQVDSWALDAMNWAVKTGLLTGSGDGLLMPHEVADRAQMAAFISRFIEIFDL